MHNGEMANQFIIWKPERLWRRILLNMMPRDTVESDTGHSETCLGTTMAGRKL